MFTAMLLLFDEPSEDEWAIPSSFSNPDSISKIETHKRWLYHSIMIMPCRRSTGLHLYFSFSAVRQ